MSISAPIVDRIRIIPRPDDFLDRNVGSSGEVFYNRATNSLRVYSGKDRAGFELARADLSNVDTSAFLQTSNLSSISIEEFSDVMYMFGPPTDGQTLVWRTDHWMPEDIQGGGGASVDVSTTAPTTPQSGNLWLNTTTGKLYIYINDGDSQQWIQPSIQPVATSYQQLLNKPTIPASINDLTDVDTATIPPSSGQVLKWNGTRWAPAADISSGTSNADAATLEGEPGSYYLDYSNFTNTPTSFANLTLTGLTTLQQSAEVFNTKTAATGVVVHDFSTGAIWYHTDLTNNFTPNFTNVSTVQNRALTAVLILNQGSTPRLPSALQINSASTTIRWQGGTQPTPNANQIDVVSFTLLRVGLTWIALGSLTTYDS
jgi:hypothetical protein